MASIGPEMRIPVVISVPDGEDLPLPRAFELRFPRPADPDAIGRALIALSELIDAMAAAWGVDARCKLLLSQAETETETETDDAGKETGDDE